MTRSDPQNAPRCIDCGEEAEFEIVDHLNGVPIPAPGDPICALCAHARGLKETDRV